MKKIIELLLKEAEKGVKKGEIPVAALIVKDGEIIARAHNQRVKKGITMGHAEILVINKANKILKDWRLTGCDMYVTLKPCNMCDAVIKESRIDNVFYLVDPLEHKKKYNKTKEIKMGDEFSNYSQKYGEMFSDFFSDKR